MTMGSFVSGMLTGVAVGVGASMLVNPMDEKEKKKLYDFLLRRGFSYGIIKDTIKNFDDIYDTSSGFPNIRKEFITGYLTSVDGQYKLITKEEVLQNKKNTSY